eukprot:scpid45430/ scgid4135/ 
MLANHYAPAQCCKACLSGAWWLLAPTFTSYCAPILPAHFVSSCLPLKPPDQPMFDPLVSLSSVSTCITTSLRQGYLSTAGKVALEPSPPVLSLYGMPYHPPSSASHLTVNGCTVSKCPYFRHLRAQQWHWATDTL